MIVVYPVSMIHPCPGKRLNISSGSTGELSNRYIRPFEPVCAVPHPRPLSQDNLSHPIMPPDTPPPSSTANFFPEPRLPSSSAEPAIEPTLTETNDPRLLHGSHCRQFSQPSAIAAEIIIEDEREGHASLAATSISERESEQAQGVTHTYDESHNESPGHKPASSDHRPFKVSFQADTLREEKWAQVDWLMDVEETQAVLQKWHAFELEAETEIRRSQTLWRDTPKSRSIMDRK